jgi:hypothetical protein
MAFTRNPLYSLLFLLFAGTGWCWAGTAAFDLPGPEVEVRVTRDHKTLPISEVPNLRAHDRLWIHPDLPETQSVNYLLIVAFLRGATNPPPDDWFIRVETWDKKVRDEGTVVTVPEGAEQALLFLAPETGGDFSSLRSAVRGKPGAFVRASQDLERASLDRSRLDAYLTAVEQTSTSEPEALHDRSVLLARSLNIKLDQQCFEKPREQQLPCLMQNTDQLVLQDEHSQSMVNQLTTGPGSDLIGQLSTTRLAGGGVYSPYVGAIVDVARMMESFHSAAYQYIPALAVPKKEELNLKLNNPPSFHKPMSVLVIGLPAVEPAQPPPLRPVNPQEVECLGKPGLVFPVEGAPLVFSSALAHDFMLRIKAKTGPAIDLPATADPARGGFVIDERKLQEARKPLGAGLDPDLAATLAGRWGFDAFEGPSFHLRSPHSQTWTVPASEQTALVIGRDDVLHLQSDSAACVEHITLKSQQGKELKAAWKEVKPGEIEVQVPLKNEQSGPLSLMVSQFGLADPDKVGLRAYAEVGHLDGFSINAGDNEGVLKGTRLDQVASLEVNQVHFVPAGLSRAEGRDELRLSVPAASAVALHSGDTLTAHVQLTDGRALDLPVTVEPPRPKVLLVSKTVIPKTLAAETAAADSGRTEKDKTADPAVPPIHLGSDNEVPQDGKLSFLLKTEIPAEFSRSEKIEVGAADGSFNALLSLDGGDLVLEDPQNMLAQIEPLKSFGASAFGPLRFRPVLADGTKGDWQPLATLVRVPAITQVRCPGSADKPCTLTGSNLFLIDSVATDPQFTESVAVPLGSLDPTIEVPHPPGPVLYIKLRDDPTVVSTLDLPANSHNTTARAGPR